MVVTTAGERAVLWVHLKAAQMAVRSVEKMVALWAAQ
jgi:hypothetical protein